MISGKSVLMELQRMLNLPDNFHQNTKQVLAPTLKQFSLIMSLVFDITAPESSATKKVHTEFIQQNYELCARMQPVWTASDNELYTSLAGLFGIQLQQQVGYEQIQIKSPLYQNYAHIGLFQVKNVDSNLIKFELSQDYQNVLMKNKSAILICYFLNEKNKLIVADQITFNGLLTESKTHPFELFNYSSTNILSFITNARFCLVYIAKRLTTEEIFQQLLQKPLLTTETFMKHLDGKMKHKIQVVSNTDEDDEELELENETVSLNSVISLKPLQYPIRSSLCRHFNKVMDLEEYLSHIRSGGAHQCQVCGKSCEFSQVFVDAMCFYLIQQGYQGSVEIGNEIKGKQPDGKEQSEESGW